MWNIVELQVEKNFAARVDYSLDELRPVACEEL
jgi:hypothetical protein